MQPRHTLLSLTATAIITSLTRTRVGRTAGLEWLPRFMPKWLQDLVLAKALGIRALLPEMRLNAAVLAEKWRQQRVAGGPEGPKEEKKAR